MVKYMKEAIKREKGVLGSIERRLFNDGFKNVIFKKRN